MGVIFLQIISILLFFALVVFFVAQFYNIIFRGLAPFIATKNKVLKKIISELDIKDDAVVYELGCGKADFLHLMRKKYPKIELVGIEHSLVPYIIAQIRNSIFKKNLKIIRQDFFKIDFSKADIVYCYLNIGTMKRLEEKFKSECKKEARIISYQFPFPNIGPEKVIEADGKRDMIYFYTIL